MEKNFYVGNVSRDYENPLYSKFRGWLVGVFMHDNIRRTDKVEIKFWRLARGQEVNHPVKKQKTAIECTFILRGKIMSLIDDQRVPLEAGDYIVIPPGVSNNVVAKIVEDVEGLTVKAPSDPTDKVIVK